MWGNAPRATSPRLRQAPPRTRRKFVLERIEPRGRAIELSGACRIGSDASNDVVLDDPTVSALHCEIDVTSTGAWVRDDGSVNGTDVDGLAVREAALRDGSLLSLGNVTLRFRWGRAEREGPGVGALALVGDSMVMKDCRARLMLAAQSAGPVLLEGESGTGKSLAAELLHEARGLDAQPCLTVECAAMSEPDATALLFGREQPRRLSVFEEARDGTLVLEEIGALTLEQQARLVPVFDRRVLARVGAPTLVPVRARLISTTRESLRRRVNAGQFRAELYFRLGANTVRLPSLRAHLEDLPQLVGAWLARNVRLPGDDVATLRSPSFHEKLRAASWPGNVRELFNHLEQCVALHRLASPGELALPPPLLDVERPWAEAREHAVASFERGYAQALLARCEGNVARAARVAGIDRAYLHRLLRRHGLRG
jgi:DNA-binding NtrC family response regulator